MPVVEAQHVGRTLEPHPLERRAAEQPEPPRVVPVVAGRVAVERVTVKGRRMVDEAETIAARGDVDDRYVRGAIG